MRKETHTSKIISSSVNINSTVENTWDKITNVEIESFQLPWYFRLMNIPKPIRAEILIEGVGGQRIAYFDNGKRFVQEIITWEKFKTYSFTFNSVGTFKAGYFFNIFQGVFKISKGTYFITHNDKNTRIELLTDYTINRNLIWILNKPIFYILTNFQKYLLNTIKVNSEKTI